MTTQQDFDNSYRGTSVLPRGGMLYTGTEYDNLTGYVDRTYTTTWHDESGNLWRKTCTVINLGRPDRGTPTDHDAVIADEPWGCDETNRVAGIKRAAAARDRETGDTIQPHLARVGSASVKELAEVAGVSKNTMRGHLLRHDDVYVEVGGGAWELVGVHHAQG